MKSFKLGILAEYIVAILYMLRFYSVLHRRMRTYVGEVDLVVVRGRQLVFIEVKARKNGLYEGIVLPRQQERIRRAAGWFLSKNPKYQGYDIRFDLAVVAPWSFPLIIKNAW